MVRVILVCVLAFLSACSKNRYEQQRDEFMLGCTEMGDEGVCECAYDKLLDIYGEEKLLMMNDNPSEMMTPEFQNNMIRSGLQCRKQ